MMVLIIATITGIVALDQISKYVVLGIIGIGGEPIVIIDGVFQITCHRNSGAAWGLFQNGRYAFLALTVIVLAFAGYIMYKIKDRRFRLMLSVIMGGALGNFIDRLIYGSVVDFLDVYIFGYDFPTFNVADSFIVVGTIALAAYLLFYFKVESEAS